MIIDIRSFEKYNSGHLDGAINISYNDLYLYPSKYLDKEKKYFLYCDTGIRSNRLVNMLNKMGYNCVNIDGGYYKNIFEKKNL